MTYIKIYKTNIEFAMDMENPSYPDILRRAKQLNIKLPDQPIFTVITPSNPDFWEQYKGEE